MNVVPDTSAVIDGRVSERIDSGAYEGATVVVPEAVVSELESQANEGRDTAWDGLAELKRLAEFVEQGTVTVDYVGRRPSAGEQAGAYEGDIDALIRDIADEYDAELLTSDVVQAEVARAKGLTVEFVEPRGRAVGELDIEQFFAEDVMSVHLKTGTKPKAKRGSIGDLRYEVIREEESTHAEMKAWAEDVIESARGSPEGFVELDQPGMTIVQFRNFRIAVARQPFADATEITAVRPVVKTDMDDYDLADELKERFTERQRGVLIAGAPGAGKSTFAQAVAEYLNDRDFAVKTMEKPRDLQVTPEITQYTALGGDMANTADALLLVRPDYTIYDEVRKTADFEVFADMRLAGVGLIGVVHATRAVDALQRLVGRVELGMIPQVVDTVVYIEAGEVHTVYDVTTEVKVPEGLTAEDLARPVIQVVDVETGRPAYEIYTFNRQVVTVPLGEGGEERETGVDRLAKQEIEREIRSAARGHVDVDLKGQDRAVAYVDQDDISYVIGKGGGRIRDIEDRLGIDIDVRTHDEKPPGYGGGEGGADGGEAGSVEPTGEVVQPEVTSRHVIIPLADHVGETVEVQADGDYLFTATVGRGGEVQVSRGSAIAEELEDAIDRKQQISVVPA
ncbi:MAG: PINc/VapC family ATPase [Haloferacaceae archaeon]